MNRKTNARMRDTFFTTTTLFLLAFLFPEIKAQENTTASAGTHEGGGGTISYTVGQTFSSVSEGVGGSSSEGIQQPYEISVVTAIKNTGGINLSIAAFPNPTVSFLYLQVQDYDLQGLSYQLYDLGGKQVKNDLIIKETTTLDVQDLKPAIYILKINKENKAIKSFKIIKN